MKLSDLTSSIRAWLAERFVPLSLVVGVLSLWIVTPQSVSSVASFSGNNSMALCTALSRVPDALGLVQEERERTEAERDAFNAFARRVEALEPTQSFQVAGRTSGGQQVPVVGDPSEGAHDRAIEDVRAAYRETVMAVRHYETEYAESLAENMSEEFGAELAEAVTGNDSLTPQLQTALVDAGHRARDERRVFLRRLDSEHKSLVCAKRSFRETLETADTIEASLRRRSMSGVDETWDRLDGLEAGCRERLVERQRQIHRAPGAVTSLSLQEYLYTSREWTYPVLGDGLDCLDRIDDVKRQVTRAVARWK